MRNPWRRVSLGAKYQPVSSMCAAWTRKLIILLLLEIRAGFFKLLLL